MKYIFVLICLFVYIFFGNELGYTKTSPFWTHLTFNFQHTGIIHLLINSLSFITIFRTLAKHINPCVLISVSFLIAVLCSFLSACDIPTVGCSGMIYAMIGIYLGWIIRKKLKIKNHKNLMTIPGCITLCLSVSYLKPNSNFMLHLTALCTACLAELAISN